MSCLLYVAGGTRQVGEEGEHYPQTQREWIKVQVAIIITDIYVTFLSAYDYYHHHHHEDILGLKTLLKC